ncbi:hypothetical protein [Longitalea arenae]|uniref:hypothetical protein n=1 Tax=Longitalea arenae TaxID=2812558 RepID=UPI00196781F0|nr:hypothetical protein [Longitalea arenae]
MTENITVTNVILTEQDRKMTYEQFGLKAAEKAQGNPEQLKEALPIIYNKIVEEAKLDKDGVHKKMEILNNEIADFENRIHSLQGKETSLSDEIELCEKQIDDIENNKGSTEILQFIIAAFITLFLTFYLWAFYAASGYAALNGVKSGKSGFSGIFAALSDAFNKGGFVVVLTVLFPIIFLGLGFLINDALERRKYGMIAILLVFTLCFDAIIGYQISKHIYTNEYNAGETDVAWQFSHVFKDINFYLVLASGFVCYVMWGFLLNYTLIKQKEIQPDSRIRKLKRKITELKTDMQQTIAEIKSCENNILKRKKNIHDYEIGKVTINVTKLKALIGEFIGGWVAWINLMRREDAETLVTKTTVFKDEWLNKKILELDEEK